MNQRTCKHCNLTKDYILFKKESYSCKDCHNKNTYLKRKERSLVDAEYKEYLLEKVRVTRKGNKYYYKTAKRKEYIANYNKQKIKEDVNYRIKKNLRCRLYQCLKANKSISAIDLIGIDINSFKSYLVSKFKEGMTLDNYGLWHIDHIRPCVSFDLTKIEEQRLCFHYTNLQPLWAKENLSKGGNFNNTIQPPSESSQDT